MKRIIKIGFLALTSLIPISVVAASCTVNTNSLNLKKSVDSNGFLSENINILALGDSITAGFNSEYSFELPGSFKNSENAKVEGLSYPSFFVELLQKIKPNFVNKYENIALSGTKIVDWLYLLNTPNFEYDINAKGSVFKFLSKLDIDANNPFRNRIKEHFGDFSKNSLVKVGKQVADANFISLSLGANDLFQSLDFDLIQKIFQNPSEENVNSFKKSLEETYQNIAKNFDMLLKRIKSLNSEAKIAVVGYPFILLRAKPLVDELFRGTNIPFKVFEKLNQINKQVAQANNVAYVETYDEKTWLVNSKTLAHSIFDIHPTEEGYKKMAIELFRKLAFNYSNPSEINAGQDQKYIEKDQDSIHKIFETNQSNEKLQEILDKFVNEKTNYQTKINRQKDKFLSIQSNIVKGWISSNKLAIKPILEKIFANDEDLKRIFSREQFINKIISTIEKDKLIDDIVIEMHKYFDENDLLINRENLLKFLFTQKILFRAFKTIIKIDFSEEEKKAIAKGFSKLLDKIDLIDPKLSGIKNNTDIKLFIENIILNVLNNKNQYLETKNLEDILSVYFKNNSNQDFKPLIKAIVSNDFVFEKLFAKLKELVPQLSQNKNLIKSIFQNITEFSIYNKVKNYFIQKIINKEINLSDLSNNNFNDLNIGIGDFLGIYTDFQKLPNNSELKKELNDLISSITENLFGK
ncbi:SGNH/GDSL hydrolase family protein [[Mycoplasma] phocae]|nr:SGNH/GDSL hydrolase family protein [[Mycoplasma] phocae]